MTPTKLRERLFDLADPGYREFHLRTCPDAEHLIGVRVPEQRKLAREIIKSSDYFYFLDQIEPYHYEEKLITGIIIASSPMSLAERLDYVTWFLPLINNWAICDGFCASFKPQPTDLPRLWDYVVGLRNSSAEFTLRFMFVMILDHLLSSEKLADIFNLLDQVSSDQHYVEMAKAWLVAELLIKFYPETFDYLQRDQLSPFAHNKSIQKARESLRLTADQKSQLLGLKL